MKKNLITATAVCLLITAGVDFGFNVRPSFPRGQLSVSFETGRKFRVSNETESL